MTRTITGLSASELLAAAALPILLAAAPLRADGAGVPDSRTAAPAAVAGAASHPVAPPAGQGTSGMDPAGAAATALEAAVEADRSARALEQNAAQALKEALSKAEEPATTERKSTSGTSGAKGELTSKGDAPRKGAEDTASKASAAKWETERLQVIHSMAKSAAASAAADLQLARIKYAAAAATGTLRQQAGDEAAPMAAVTGSTNVPQREENPPPPGGTVPSSAPLSLMETALVSLGMCFLGAAAAGALFRMLQRKDQLAEEDGKAAGLSDLRNELTSIRRQIAALAGQQPAPAPQTLPQKTLPAPAAPALPAHAVLALSCTVALEDNGWRKICQDSLGLLELVQSGWALVGGLPNELNAFPAHQDVAWRMLERSRSQTAEASGLTVWTVRMRDAMASGLLHDPELPAFSGGGENPEHHFRRRFIRDVLSPELGPLLIAMEELRHLNDFLPELQGPDLSGHARRLEEAIKELLRRSRDDFGFEIEYVPLLAVCDFRSLKITKNGDPARLPDYYQELKCDDKAVRGILRYGNQSTGLTPDSPTEIVYSP